jgi:hypothetical protein
MVGSQRVSIHIQFCEPGQSIVAYLVILMTLNPFDTDGASQFLSQLGDECEKINFVGLARWC